jgi:hypothetical protein
MSTAALQASACVADMTPPSLTGFDLDMNAQVTENGLNLASAQLTLRFSETVNLTTFNPSAISIQYMMSSASTSVSLTGSNLVISTYNSNMIVFKLLRSDANAIKAFYSLAKNTTNTFLSITPTMVKDMSGNAITSIASSSALGVTSYNPDITSPQLLSFSIDMTGAYVSLTFDETVDGTTILPTEFSLQDGVTPIFVKYTLTGGIASNGVAYMTGLLFGNTPSITPKFYFTKSDLDTIKSLPLCTTAPNCFLVNTEYAVKDMAGNRIIPCV